MTAWILFALLLGLVLWWDISGRGPRWRSALEERVYQWIIRRRKP